MKPATPRKTEVRKVRHADGRIEEVQVNYVRDIAKRQRVDELFAAAERLEPSNPYVLLHRAQKANEPAKRLALLKTCWTKGGSEFFPSVCLELIVSTAKKVPDQDSDWVASLDSKSEMLKRGFWNLLAKGRPFDPRGQTLEVSDSIFFKRSGVPGCCLHTQLPISDTNRLHRRLDLRRQRVTEPERAQTEESLRTAQAAPASSTAP